MACADEGIYLERIDELRNRIANLEKMSAKYEAEGHLKSALRCDARITEVTEDLMEQEALLAECREVS